MLKAILVFCCLTGLVLSASAQNDSGRSKITSSAMDSLRKNTNDWNEAFNHRDSTASFALADSSIAESVPSGTTTGLEKFKAGVKNLWSKRPDVTMHWSPSTIEVNPQWPFA